jgi:hypothetical protein
MHTNRTVLLIIPCSLAACGDPQPHNVARTDATAPGNEVRTSGSGPSYDTGVEYEPPGEWTTPTSAPDGLYSSWGAPPPAKDECRPAEPGPTPTVLVSASTPEGTLEETWVP